MQDLERIYDGFINHEQPLTFFKGLHEYLDYIFSVPELKRVFDQQMGERTVLIKQIESLEKETRRELDQAKTKLITLIKKTKVDEMSFLRYLTHSINDKTTLLQELEAYENRTILHGTFVSDDIERYLFDIAANLLNAGHKKKLKEFIVSPEEYAIHYRGDGPGQYLRFGNQDSTLIFSKTLSERREKERNFERERMLESWGSFEVLLQFDIAYKFAMSKDTSLASVPPSGTEKTPWFGLAKERNKIFSMAQELQRLAESQLDFHSMITTRFEKVQVGELKNLKQITLRDAAQVVHSRLLRVTESKIGEGREQKRLKSIDLITASFGSLDTIFLVLDGHFEMPIRCAMKNNKGGIASIKKLYDVAYFVDAPDKKVFYDRNLADNINNGLFKIVRVKEYMETNGFKKPTLVKKSNDNILVLNNEVVVKTGLIRKNVPTHLQYQYTDKTK
ncbi:MAG: hypothetical protein Q7R98_02315 [Candidatus Jorgensenbacteria bacterium]|nr:hypothetical protein [Candidatus Jorgensenbacteria bacterium]